jgi:hypothetical protein
MGKGWSPHRSRVRLGPIRAPASGHLAVPLWTRQMADNALKSRCHNGHGFSLDLDAGRIGPNRALILKRPSIMDARCPCSIQVRAELGEAAVAALVAAMAQRDEPAQPEAAEVVAREPGDTLQ